MVLIFITQGENITTAIKKRKKTKISSKSTRKRSINYSEWMDVNRKKLLNSGKEH